MVYYFYYDINKILWFSCFLKIWMHFKKLHINLQYCHYLNELNIYIWSKNRQLIHIFYGGSTSSIFRIFFAQLCLYLFIISGQLSAIYLCPKLIQIENNGKAKFLIYLTNWVKWFRVLLLNKLVINSYLQS